jgi:hypothetical protein
MNHPITPPPELRQLWAQQTQRMSPRDPVEWMRHVSEKAAQWGADQELLACGNYLKQCAQWEEEDVTEFYNYRRPKPPSLKERALEAMHRNWNPHNNDDFATIARALEALPE